MSPAERSLVTVLFTDIVGSTERATELGDRAWRTLLERHHAQVRQELRRFGGREAGIAGDGFLALFERPARAIACAGAIRDAIRDVGMAVRCGVHMGEVEVMEKTVGGIGPHRRPCRRRSRARRDPRDAGRRHGRRSRAPPPF